MKFALDKLKEKLTDDIYIIPVLLETMENIPNELRNIQYIEAAEVNCIEKIANSISFQLEKIGQTITENQKDQKVTWSKQTYREQWDGLPGYEVEFSVIRFNSNEYNQIYQISDILFGDMTKRSLRERRVKLEQNTEQFNFGQNKFMRTNTWYAFPGEPEFKGPYYQPFTPYIGMGQAAAHPNMHFRTYNFTLDPITQIMQLEELFSDLPAALSIIQAAARERD